MREDNRMLSLNKLEPPEDISSANLSLSCIWHSSQGAGHREVKSNAGLAFWVVEPLGLHHVSNLHHFAVTGLTKLGRQSKKL